MKPPKVADASHQQLNSLNTPVVINHVDELPKPTTAPILLNA